MGPVGISWLHVQECLRRPGERLLPAESWFSTFILTDYVVKYRKEELPGDEIPEVYDEGTCRRRKDSE